MFVGDVVLITDTAGIGLWIIGTRIYAIVEVALEVVLAANAMEKQ